MSPSRLRRTQRRERRAAVRVLQRPKMGEQLLQVWDHACWVFANFCEFIGTPSYLADREHIITWEYKEIQEWLAQLELLTRRLILAAALSLNVVLKPLREATGKARKRRRVLIWPNRPRTWIARFRMMPKRPPDVRFIYSNTREKPRTLPAMPLAKRLEAVRRVLADPDVCARRFATRLARIAERNAKANEPRLLRARAWDPEKSITQGRRYIHEGMKLVMPIIEDALDRWNERFEPG